MSRSKVADWWYKLTIQRRKEILKEYGASYGSAKKVYSELPCYAKAAVRTVYRRESFE